MKTSNKENKTEEIKEVEKEEKRNLKKEEKKKEKKKKEKKEKKKGRVKEAIKRAFKYLLPAYLIAFVSAFMLFVYEPINMYATNTDDFWFDLYIMLKPTLLLALAFFGALIVLYTIVYIINNLISKKLCVYKVIVIISLIVFVCLYVQGNFLISSLPHLDGSEIIWDDYTKATVMSTGILAVIAAVITFATIKFKYDKTIKIYAFITGTIFFMLAISLTSTLLTTSALKRKNGTVLATTTNINNASTNKNFFILLLDCVDSTDCREVLEKSEYKRAFNDFTYFPDTMSTYAFTRESTAYILSGIWNENKEPYEEYNNKALDNSKLLNTLDQEGYDLNIYNYDLAWAGENAKKLKNGMELERNMNDIVYLKQICKYVAFKYWPYELKRFSRIETMDFGLCKEGGDGISPMGWRNRWYYRMVTGNEIVKQDKNYFSYTHLEGGHVPFWCDKDFNEIENGTYADAIEGSLHTVDAFIQRLKDSGVYDNSVIIIMSDHGFNGNTTHYGRQNPIFFVKGINEHHDQMLTSDKPVSYEDLDEIYMELLDEKTSEEILPNIDYNRKRRYLLYAYGYEDHMVEYEQTGKAWDEDTMVETGRVFDLEK